MAAGKLIRVGLLGVALVGAAFGGMHYWTTGRWMQSTDNAYVRADITAITSRVAGELISVEVHNNQAVKKGDVLMRIDARDFEAKLANARAMVAAAEAAITVNQRTQTMQGAMVEQAAATLNAAQAERQRAQKDQTRAQSLVREGVATVARLDVSTAAFQSADAMVSKGAAGLKAARSQGSTMEAENARLAAQLQAARASEQLAALDLEATSIRAPVDGVVGDLAAKQGERINAGLRLLSLVAAGPRWVEANYKETQLTRVVVGQSAEVEVDAFPGVKIAATVESVSPASGAEFSLLPPDNATGNFTKVVQRVPVRLALKPPPELEAKLRSGMSVEAVIDTRPAKG